MTKAAILTIGTEITSGEITNRNATDLAEKLENLNIECVCHLSVPDDRPLILKACRFVEDLADVLIFTGGLGPTSDDFTREVVSQWLELEMEFDKEVFSELELKFRKLNRQLKPGHRNECLFPMGSKKYVNPVGHAQAFSIKKRINNKDKFIVVLPGPPNEIQGIWESSLCEELSKINPIKSRNLYKFKFLGKGESEIAELTEEIFKDSGFLLGYRATIPYVYVKIWVPAELDKNKEVYFEKLKTQLKDYLVEKDYFSEFQTHLQLFNNIVIVDSVTEGKSFNKWISENILSLIEKISFRTDVKLASKDNNSTIFGVEVEGSMAWRVFSRINGKEQVTILPTPYGMNSGMRRIHPYLTEKSAEIWLEHLKK